jgi:tRNA(Ile)-lysidine synthase
MLQNALLKSLEESGVDPSQTILLGFSGGPDSLALLHALKALGYAVTAAHFDHALRPVSAADAERAEQIAAELGAPFLVERGDVNAYAKAAGMSIEEAARELRYRFLFMTAKKLAAQVVMTAHHADDQVETVLMHLLRGAGSAGLRGMALRLLPNPWSETVALVRPMLGIWRSEIEQYCAENQLDSIVDPSNRDTTFFRNRLRHEVIPFLEDVSPGLKSRLHNSAQILAADQEVIEGLTQQAWAVCLAKRGADFLAFDRTSFLTQPLALQHGLLRLAVAEMRPLERNLNFDSIELAVSAIKNPSGTATDWLAGLYLLVEANQVWIADWEAELPITWPQAPAHALNLESPSITQLGSDWRLELKPDGGRSVTGNSDGYQAWLDPEEVGEELILRRRRPGDRFQPLGMASGSLKLSDFMINEKMPARARSGWPLVCKGNEIVWVPGYRLAHPYRLREHSRRALHLHLAKN